ncbi:MAG: hypothetical protein OXM59_12305 [Gammaproteobacteria bacterium]|nr:hypothetical protein [Gammaproteobacteria bacterium]
MAEGTKSKIYKYDGEEFTIAAPKECRIAVTHKGTAGKISIIEESGQFRVDTPSSATRHGALKDALHACCQRLVVAAKQLSRKEQCKHLDEFYDNLD